MPLWFFFIWVVSCRKTIHLRITIQPTSRKRSSTKQNNLPSCWVSWADSQRRTTRVTALAMTSDVTKTAIAMQTTRLYGTQEWNYRKNETRPPVLPTMRLECPRSTAVAEPKIRATVPSIKNTPKQCMMCLWTYLVHVPDRSCSK